MRSRLWPLLLVPLLFGAGQPIDPHNLAWDSSGGPDIVAGYEVVQGWDGSEVGSTVTGLSVPLAARTGTAYAARVRALPVDPETSPSNWATLAAEWPDAVPQILSLSELGRTTAPLPGGGPVMAASFVQGKTYAGAAAASHSIVLDSTPTQNNLLILDVVSDSTVNTPSGWTLAVSNVNWTGTYTYYKIAGASESATITVSPSSSATTVILAQEWSGLTATPLDKTANNFTSGTSLSTGTTATTAQADELLHAFVGINQFDAQNTTAWSNSFVERQNIRYGSGEASSHVRGVNSDKVVSATGAYSTTATLTAGNNTLNSAVITTWKIAEGGAAATALPRRALDGPFYGALRGSVR